ncbi:DUF1190 domain-containing protein [Dyella tabacisoli]|uniref:DUF1190 domain-containing protein n=1 Tax=Dyella tabacisoli TaxID=2282381 RepID=A0A369UQ55_9GAMM|nr:DUF1190 domain-containing protein [Dyella tabacisoli]RDD81750.1 DUF1190 domain-containing protein [Dyella tabacisoli]
MKRSSTAALLLMGVTPLMLTACGGDSHPAAAIKEQSYANIAYCAAAGNPQADCQRAFDQAQENSNAAAPHYKTREDCLKEFGPDMCQPRSDAHEGSFWGPVMTGFILGRMFDGGSSRYYGAEPLYRQRDGQDYRPSPGSYGGSFGSSRSGTGSVGGSTDAAGSRAVTASRGGFGSVSAARGGWGG